MILASRAGIRSAQKGRNSAALHDDDDDDHDDACGFAFADNRVDTALHRGVTQCQTDQTWGHYL